MKPLKNGRIRFNSNFGLPFNFLFANRTGSKYIFFQILHTTTILTCRLFFYIEAKFDPMGCRGSKSTGDNIYEKTGNFNRCIESSEQFEQLQLGTQGETGNCDSLPRSPFLQSTYDLIERFFSFMEVYKDNPTFKPFVDSLNYFYNYSARYVDILAYIFADKDGRSRILNALAELNKSIDLAINIVLRFASLKDPLETGRGVRYCSAKLQKFISTLNRVIFSESRRLLKERAAKTRADIVDIAKYLAPINETFDSEVDMYLDRISTVSDSSFFSLHIIYLTHLNYQSNRIHLSGSIKSFWNGCKLQLLKRRQKVPPAAIGSTSYAAMQA